MTLPTPEPGLVVQYGFLWGHEADRGRDNARYPRPCAVVLARTVGEGGPEVILAPFTHQPPDVDRAALRLPERVRAHLGLTEPTWVMLDELNVFEWPGHDLERNAAGEFVWGWLPPLLHRRIAEGVAQAARTPNLRLIRR